MSTLDLPPDVQQFLHDQVAGGSYRSEDIKSIYRYIASDNASAARRLRQTKKLRLLSAARDLRAMVRS